MKLKLGVPFLIALTTGCNAAPFTPEQLASMQATADRSTQMFQMSMQNLNQQQQRSLNATSYTPIQQANGTWVRCVMVSSSTASCIAY